MRGKAAKKIRKYIKITNPRLANDDETKPIMRKLYLELKSGWKNTPRPERSLAGY